MSDRISELLARHTREHAMNSDAAAQGRREAMLDVEKMPRKSMIVGDIYETLEERIESRRRQAAKYRDEIASRSQIPGCYIPESIGQQREFCAAYVERAEVLLEAERNGAR